MAFRISYKLNRAQHDAAYEFYKQVLQGAEQDAPGPTTFEEFAKQCLFYTINKCREEAAQLAKVSEQTTDKLDVDPTKEGSEGELDGIASSGDIATDHSETPVSSTSDPNSLADSSQSGDPSPSQQ